MQRSNFLLSIPKMPTVHTNSPTRLLSYLVAIWFCPLKPMLTSRSCRNRGEGEGGCFVHKQHGQKLRPYVSYYYMPINKHKSNSTVNTELEILDDSQNLHLTSKACTLQLHQIKKVSTTKQI